MHITVRTATPADQPWVMGQLEQFSRFFGSTYDLLGSGETAQTFIEGLIRDHLVLVADAKDAGPVGFIAGWVGPHPYNSAISTLTETFWWVDEAHRGTRAGLMLLDAFVEWGRSNSKWITFTLETHSPVSDRCLTRRGFKPIERNYLLEVV